MTTIEKVPHTGPANEMSGSSPLSEYNDLGLGCRHKPYTKVIAAPQFNINGKITQCIGPRFQYSCGGAPIPSVSGLLCLWKGHH